MPRSRALYRRAFTDLTPTSRAIEVLNSGREVAKESLPEWSEGDRNQLIRTWEENVEMVKFAAKFASKGMMVEDAIALGHAYDVPGSLNAKQAIVQFRANPWEHVGEKVQRSRDDRREPWLSFGQMDTLAQMLNADPASPHRIIGCAVNFLAHSLADCNTTVETEMLARGVATSLRLDGDVVWHTLREHTTGDNSASSPILTQRVGSKIMSGLRDMVSAELRSAQLLAELLDTPLAKTYDVSEDDVRGVSDLDLDPVQVEAVRMTLGAKLSVLTGPPGTGKTTITSTVVAMADHLGLKTTLMATTGRAATKLSAACNGRPASTMHHVLEWRPGSPPKRNESNPLEGDLFLCDESSFLDATALANLLRALPKQGRLTLVGDINQIPSVGPGRVLADLIEILPTTRLTKVFRQALDSPIVAGAHRILAGDFPDIEESPDGYYTLINPQTTALGSANVVAMRRDEMSPREQDNNGLDLLMQCVEFLLSNGAHPYWIQAIASRYAGPAGVDRINETMRERMNPFSPQKREIEVRRKDGKKITLREGDKIIFKSNVKSGSEGSDSGKIWSGSMGRIRKIDPMGESLTVHLDTREKHTVPRRNFRDMMHAYCITTHSSQGSEFNHVIMPIEASWEGQAQRYMVYTASTRAKTTMAFISTPDRLQRAIDNNDVADRTTMLLPAYKAIREAEEGPASGQQPTPGSGASGPSMGA